MIDLEQILQNRMNLVDARPTFLGVCHRWENPLSLHVGHLLLGNPDPRGHITLVSTKVLSFLQALF